MAHLWHIQCCSVTTFVKSLQYLRGGEQVCFQPGPKHSQAAI
jgi:hypothetical protein